MKELTIEEKVKRYDEAIKKAKSKIKNDKDHVLYEDDVLEIFPELKESEDEKMLNQLHSWMKEFGGAEEYTEKVYLWIKGLLEKQGNYKSTDTCNSLNINSKEFPAGEKRDFGYFSKSADKVEPKFKIGDKVKSIIDGFECTIESIDNDCYYGDTTNFDIQDQDGWELAEQNPAWSEEDINMFGSILSTLGICANNPQIPADVRLIHKKEESWFNELYHRVQLKQEWSEEDEKMFKSLKTLLNKASCYSCTEGVDKILAWLKQKIGR